MLQRQRLARTDNNATTVVHATSAGTVVDAVENAMTELNAASREQKVAWMDHRQQKAAPRAVTRDSRVRTARVAMDEVDAMVVALVQTQTIEAPVAIPVRRNSVLLKETSEAARCQSKLLQPTACRYQFHATRTANRVKNAAATAMAVNVALAAIAATRKNVLTCVSRFQVPKCKTLTQLPTQALHL